jgi:hypothetical protein
VTKKDESNNTGVIRLRPSDNVAVAIHAVSPGTPIAAENVTALDAIPFGHKIATHAIAKDEPVRKYAQALGVATRDIAPGRHMHVQYVAFSDLRSEAEQAPVYRANEKPRTFTGYKRAGGRVATRNYICVLTSVNCSATVARHIAEEASIGHKLPPLLFEDGPDRPILKLGMFVRLGVGDALIQQPDVHLLVTLEAQPGREEALARQAHLVLDLALHRPPHGAHDGGVFSRCKSGDTGPRIGTEMEQSRETEQSRKVTTLNLSVTTLCEKTW